VSTKPIHADYPGLIAIMRLHHCAHFKVLSLAVNLHHKKLPDTSRPQLEQGKSAAIAMIDQDLNHSQGNIRLASVRFPHNRPLLLDLDRVGRHSLLLLKNRFDDSICSFHDFQMLLGVPYEFAVYREVWEVSVLHVLQLMA
jgi:hypothetical protein